MANVERKRGRPAGTPNVEAPRVICTLPACPKPGCASTEREVLRVVRDRPGDGVVDGQAYNFTTWRRVRCRACGQVYVLISYELRRERNGNPDS